MVVVAAWRIRSASALWFCLALMVVREESKSGACSVADSCGRRWWLLCEMKVHERLRCRHGFLTEKMTCDSGRKVCGFESGSQVQWWLTMEVAVAATGSALQFVVDGGRSVVAAVTARGAEIMEWWCCYFPARWWRRLKMVVFLQREQRGAVVGHGGG